MVLMLFAQFAGSWSDLFGLNSASSSVQEPQSGRERRYSDPSDLDVAIFRQLTGECSQRFEIDTAPKRKSKDDIDVS